jgi:hypothetical protein
MTDYDPDEPSKASVNTLLAAMKNFHMSLAAADPFAVYCAITTQGGYDLCPKCAGELVDWIQKPRLAFRDAGIDIYGGKQHLPCEKTKE